LALACLLPSREQENTTMKNIINIVNLTTMKTQFHFFATMLLVVGLIASTHAAKDLVAGNPDNLKVAASPGLENLLINWESIYNSMDPSQMVKSTSQSEAELLLVNGSFISQHPELAKWSMVVGRNVIIPVIHADNPRVDQIVENGVTLSTLAGLIGNKADWSVFAGNASNATVSLIVMDDKALISQTEDFLKVGIDLNKATVCATEADFREAMKANVNALGLVYLPAILDGNEPVFAEGLRIMPIDRNNNGKLEPMENFYHSVESFTRSVWIGKYPVALTNNIYVVSPENVVAEGQTAFLSWVLTQGQRHLIASGFADLSTADRQAGLAMINLPEMSIEKEETSYAWLTILLLIIVGMTGLGFLVTWLFRDRQSIHGFRPEPAGIVFNEDSVEAPKGILYDKTHTWAFMENNGEVKVGVDDFIQHLAGHHSKINTKAVGEKVTKGDYLFTVVCDGKQMSLRSPITGVIKAKNLAVENGILPGSVIDNWIYQIEPGNWKRDSQFMIMAEQYKQWIKSEFVRLRDFMAAALNAHAPQYAHIALQDGGELQDGMLADLGPEIWEDFQYGFLDTAR
jgi:glycine cleavage system H lipoate-binding protein